MEWINELIAIIATLDPVRCVIVGIVAIAIVSIVLYFNHAKKV
jgi:hypothetical protein